MFQLFYLLWKLRINLISQTFISKTLLNAGSVKECGSILVDFLQSVSLWISRLIIFPKWRVFHTVTKIYSNETNKLKASEANFIVYKLVCWKLPLFKFRYLLINSISETVRWINAAWCGCYFSKFWKRFFLQQFFVVYWFATFSSYSIPDVLICNCFIQDGEK